MRVLREQREATIRLAALLLVDLENARQDIFVAPWTITRRALAFWYNRDQKSRLYGKNRVPLAEVDAVCQLLVDSGAKVACFRTFLRGFRDEVDEFSSPSSS